MTPVCGAAVTFGVAVLLGVAVRFGVAVLRGVAVRTGAWVSGSKEPPNREARALISVYPLWPDEEEEYEEEEYEEEEDWEEEDEPP